MSTVHSSPEKGFDDAGSDIMVWAYEAGIRGSIRTDSSLSRRHQIGPAAVIDGDGHPTYDM